MAEPIANDWKAIHERMQQIRAEQSVSSRPCPLCQGRGWISSPPKNWRPLAGGFAICDLCHNPKNLSPPRTASSR